MSNKYHISPDTKRPNLCRAAEGNCPLGGGEEPHFDNKVDARAYVEKTMKSQEIAEPITKKRGRPRKDDAVEAAETLSLNGLLEAAQEAQELGEDWEEEYYDDLPEEEVKPEELEEISLDDDFSDIKCDTCARPLDKCICGECEYCGAYEEDEHEEDCPHYKPVRKAYSWD